MNRIYASQNTAMFNKDNPAIDSSGYGSFLPLSLSWLFVEIIVIGFKHNITIMSSWVF